MGDAQVFPPQRPQRRASLFRQAQSRHGHMRVKSQAVFGSQACAQRPFHEQRAGQGKPAGYQAALHPEQCGNIRTPVSGSAAFSGPAICVSISVSLPFPSAGRHSRRKPEPCVRYGIERRDDSLRSIPETFSRVKCSRTCRAPGFLRSGCSFLSPCWSGSRARLRLRR